MESLPDIIADAGYGVLAAVSGLKVLSAQRETPARAPVRAYSTFAYRDPAGYRDQLPTLRTRDLRTALAGSAVDLVAPCTTGR